MSEHTLPASEARNDFFTLLDRIKRLREKYTITKDGHPEAVLMSAEEFGEWLETLEILSRSETLKGIRRGLREMKKKKFVTHEKIFGRAPHARS